MVGCPHLARKKKKKKGQDTETLDPKILCEGNDSRMTWLMDHISRKSARSKRFRVEKCLNHRESKPNLPRGNKDKSEREIGALTREGHLIL